MDTPRIREKKKKIGIIAKPWQVGIIIKVKDLSDTLKDFIYGNRKIQNQRRNNKRH
jgi:hypothetical protein